MATEFSSTEFWIRFAMASLAAWRITHLFAHEDGPFDVIYRVRALSGAGFWGRLLDCFYCLSLWVALPLGLYSGSTRLEKALLWLSLSAGAILIQNLFIQDKNSPSE